MNIHLNTVFETEAFLIRPLELSDYESMRELTSDPEMWLYFCKDLSNDSELKNWIKTSVNDKSKHVYTIIDKLHDRVIGSTSIIKFSKITKTVEIGCTWLSKDYQGKGVNYQVKKLLLNHLFDTCNFERVEFKINTFNTPARLALLKLGLVEEGFSQSSQEMTLKPNEEKIIFSTLKPEWRVLRKRYKNNALQV